MPLLMAASIPVSSKQQSLGGPFIRACESDEDILHKCLRGSSSSSPTSSSSHRKALRFIHVTKCAGSSVESISQKRWGKYDMDYCGATVEISTDRGSWWHVPLRLAKPHVLRDLLKKYDYFVVVRNPFDRVVSEFYCPWGGAGKKRDADVHGFNSWINAKLEGLLSSPSLHGHWAPQSIYVQDSEGKLLVYPDNVLFMEDLQTQYASLVGRYALPQTFALNDDVHVNQGQDKKFCAADLDSRNVELVKRIYAHDFEYFGYDRIPPPRKVAHEKGKDGSRTVGIKADLPKKGEIRPLSHKISPALDSNASFADLLSRMNKRRKVE